MLAKLDPDSLKLLSGILALLCVASLIGWVLHLRTRGGPSAETVANLNARIRSWWLMCAVFALAMLSGPMLNIGLFAAMSALALREFLGVAPPTAADRVGVWVSFLLLLPLQYYFIVIGWYGMFSIFLPVYGFLFLAAAAAFAGDASDFLARTARLHWGTMICVFCVSHAPALLTLEIPGYRGNGKLLFYLLVVVQLSDVLQYVWGKLFGKHKLAPTISPSKTVEGLVGGVLSASGVGAALYWVTPFSPWQAAVMSFMVCILGFLGGLVMSAIKRDRGVKDWGTLIEGHGGMMDRIDSVCFAAPVFFHVTRFFFAP
jgi:phosphatidate cytidylyltransferase